MQADNDNEAPIRLADILPMVFPYGGMSVAGLRREAGRGRLTIMRIAGKDFTTMRSIQEMKSKCLVPANQPAYGSGQPTTTAPPYGSSSMAASNTALDAANMIVRRLSAR